MIHLEENEDLEEVEEEPLGRGKELIITILYLRERNKVIKAYTRLVAYLLKFRIMA